MSGCGKVTDDMPDPEKPGKDKIFYIRYLKNLNYHPGVPVYLELVKDTSPLPLASEVVDRIFGLVQLVRI